MITAIPDTLRGRESVLHLILRDVIDEYREHIEATCAYEAFLEAKIETLERLYRELRGRPRLPPPNMGDDEPF